MKIYRLIRVFVVTTALLGLAACTTDTTTPITDDTGGPSSVPSVRPSTSNLQCISPEDCRTKALAVNTFYFDFDVAEFRTGDREILSHHAQQLASDPSMRVRLEGHADERGTREYNIALGERRAEGIQNYLVVNGASRSQIEVVSYGEERPAVRGTSERAYQRNRRVVIIDR